MCRRGLRPYTEYYEAESETRNQSAVNPKGELWEQETLQLRVNPPEIEIDNSSVEDATRMTVCSANRHGTLVEVMKCFVNLGLLVKRACISSDQDWFADDFYVTEKNGEKVRDPEKLDVMRKVLAVEPRGRAVITEGEFGLEMSGQDKPGLLADITQLLAGYGYQVKSAAVWTQGISVAFVMTIKRMEHNKNVRFPEQLCQALTKELSGGSDCAVVSPTRCRGHVHHEHRLHFMLLKEAKKREHLHSDIDCSFQGQQWTSSQMTAMDDVLCKFRSPKLGKPNVSIQSDRRRGYWIINIRCKDRSKLLFDTVCTLADLDFDVYHGSVDCRNEMAELELFVRPRFQHLESIQDRIEEVQRFLADAIIRRFPNGLKLHVHPSNEPECLGTFLHALKAANLCVTRAKVRCTDQGRTVHTVHVMNSNGSPPDRDIVERACHAVGSHLIFCGCQGKDTADTCSGSESFKRRDCAFFWKEKERALEVQWNGKSCSV